MVPDMRGATVRPLEGRGNGVVATRDLARNDVLLVCRAWLAFVDDKHYTCAYCLSDADPMGPALTRCRSCKETRYCSGRCQELARTTHDCDTIIRLHAAVSIGDDEDGGEDIETAALLWSAMHGPNRHALFDQLCTSGPVPLSVERAAIIAAKVNALHMPHCPPMDAAHVHTVLARDLLNCFGIDAPMRDGESGEDGQPDVNYLGRCLVPEASFFSYARVCRIILAVTYACADHSCNANVSRVRHGRQMVFYAARAIAAGEECTITYSSRGAVERRAFLFEHYGFMCECALCASAQDVRALGERCSHCGCERWDGGLCVVCDAQRIAEALLEASP